MSMMECATCGQAVDARSTHSCRHCGGLLCPECAEDADGTCPECGEQNQ